MGSQRVGHDGATNTLLEEVMFEPNLKREQAYLVLQRHKELEWGRRSKVQGHLRQAIIN